MLFLTRMPGGGQHSHFSYEESEVQRLHDGPVDTQIGNCRVEPDPHTSMLCAFFLFNRAILGIQREGPVMWSLDRHTLPSPSPKPTAPGRTELVPRTDWGPRGSGTFLSPCGPCSSLPLSSELGLLHGLSLVGSRPIPDVTHQAWAPRRLQDTGRCLLRGHRRGATCPGPRWAKKTGTFAT